VLVSPTRVATATGCERRAALQHRLGDSVDQQDSFCFFRDGGPNWLGVGASCSSQRYENREPPALKNNTESANSSSEVEVGLQVELQLQLEVQLGSWSRAYELGLELLQL
jgi:hypothetical protein